MAVAVVVPWRGGCAYREAAWQWVRNRYETEGYEVIEGRCPDGPWVKAFAIQDAIDRTDADILVISDADVWCDQLPEAIDRTSTRPVVIPHGQVHRLTEHESARFMAGGDRPYLTAEPPRRGMAGGGIVILRRDVWDLCPMDPRFQGWGQEDYSLATALTTMTGKIARYSHPLIHLWHPPQSRLTRATGSVENRALEARYLAASRDRRSMEALLDEARTALRRQPWHSLPPMTSKPA